MSNDYYTPSGSPSTGSSGSSAVVRGEFGTIQSSFDKLPPLNTHGNEYVRVNAGGSALESRNNVQLRSDIGLVIGANVEAWSTELDALAALDATVGVLIKTAANTYVRRNVVGVANEITVTNGNGVSGNIAVSLPNALTFTGKTVSGGTFNNSTVTNLLVALAVNSGGTGLNSLSTNNVLLGNGTNAVQSVAPGTANNALFSNGSTWVSRAPLGTDGASMVLLATAAAANSATVDFISGITSTYDEYVVTLTNVIPATDAAQIWLRVSEDGGGTFKAGATDYASTRVAQTDNNAPTGAGSTGDAKIVMAAALSNSKPYCGEVRFWAPAGTAVNKMFKFTSSYLTSAGTTIASVDGSGVFQLDTNAINGLRFMMGAGNITSGNFALYGLRKS